MLFGVLAEKGTYYFLGPHLLYSAVFIRSEKDDSLDRSSAIKEG